MTIFDRLREACTAWDKRYRDYKMKSTEFAWSFAEKFRQYISAPASYVDFDRTVKWYVQPLKVVQNEVGEYSFDQPKSRGEALDRDKDGYWVTAIRITVDRDQNSFHKMYFVVLLQFAIRENTCEMDVGFQPKHFTFDITNSDAANVVYDYVLGLIHSFATPPWEVNQKSPIGFMPPQAN